MSGQSGCTTGPRFLKSNAAFGLACLGQHTALVIVARLKSRVHSPHAPSRHARRVPLFSYQYGVRKENVNSGIVNAVPSRSYP